MLSVGVDIGGTFTDVVGLRNDETVYFAKVPSTPADLIQGVRRGVERLLQASGEAPAAIGRFIHGTTIATNAILEQKGARLGLLATAGFEDILEIGRQNRATMYDLFLDAQTPVFLAPRRRRLGKSAQRPPLRCPGGPSKNSSPTIASRHAGLSRSAFCRMQARPRPMPGGTWLQYFCASGRQALNAPAAASPHAVMASKHLGLSLSALSCMHTIMRPRPGGTSRQ
jgi:hypothetical protein